ncbi:hypothetical protein ILYODFUR_035470, partial [Ilyodon furcidens]
GRRDAGAYLHPGQDASPSQGNTQTTTHFFTLKGHLERPINLTGISLDCGGKPEYLEKTHTCTGRTYKLHAERATVQTRCILCKKHFKLCTTGVKGVEPFEVREAQSRCQEPQTDPSSFTVLLPWCD